MPFIFDWCRRSSAAVILVKYEHDIKQLTSILLILENWEPDGTDMDTKGLITPTPGLLPVTLCPRVWDPEDILKI